MASKPATKPATVTLKALAAEIAEQHNLSKKQSEQMLNEIAGLLQEHLKKGASVKLAGLGILQVRKHAARMARNPMTGAPIPVKASKKVAFRAAKELKEAIGGRARGPAEPGETAEAADNGGGSTDW